MASRPPPTQEVGYGYEAQSSPLVKLSPSGALLSIDGLQHLAGGHGWAAAQGFANLPLGEGWGMSLAGDANLKRAPSASDFDFARLSIQPALHLALGSVSVGWGLNWQQIGVAGQRFRQTRGAQMDWTLTEPDESH